MQIREYKPINCGKTDTTIVMNKNNLTIPMLNWADQIICSTNKTRQSINAQIRKSKGFNPNGPQVGDKIISLENHWRTMDTEKNNSLVNGTIGTIKSISTKKMSYTFKNNFTIGPITAYEIVFETDSGEEFEVIADKKYLDTGKKTLSPKQEYYLYRKHVSPPCLFDYGYAITGHRAQGSEYEKVLVIEEYFPDDKEEHARWLYTSVTRSSQKLILAR